MVGRGYVHIFLLKVDFLTNVYHMETQKFVVTISGWLLMNEKVYLMVLALITFSLNRASGPVSNP